MRPPLRAACASRGAASRTAAMARAAAGAFHHGGFCCCRDAVGAAVDSAGVVADVDLTLASSSFLKTLRRGWKTPRRSCWSTSPASPSRVDDDVEDEDDEDTAQAESRVVERRRWWTPLTTPDGIPPRPRFIILTLPVHRPRIAAPRERFEPTTVCARACVIESAMRLRASVDSLTPNMRGGPGEWLSSLCARIMNDEEEEAFGK